MPDPCTRLAAHRGPRTRNAARSRLTESHARATLARVRRTRARDAHGSLRAARSRSWRKVPVCDARCSRKESSNVALHAARYDLLSVRRSRLAKAIAQAPTIPKVAEQCARGCTKARPTRSTRGLRQTPTGTRHCLRRHLQPRRHAQRDRHQDNTALMLGRRSMPRSNSTRACTSGATR
jgi:hypothetical protein